MWNLLEMFVEDIIGRGGEGAIVRNPAAHYQCSRTHDSLKVKPCEDAEGTVIGLRTGYRTEKDSRHLGRMGALLLALENGKTLELSGFTDAERELANDLDNTWALANPGSIAPDWLHAAHFPPGTTVTFRYRGKTRDGIPTEARYWRKREDE